MTNIVKQEQVFQQKLIDKYEKLRTLILSKNESPLKNSLGYSILLLRGTTVWIETCLAGEESDAKYKGLSYGQPTHSVTSNDSCTSNELGESFQAEATRILTNMVIQHQEMRNCNV